MKQQTCGVDPFFRWGGGGGERKEKKIARKSRNIRLCALREIENGVCLVVFQVKFKGFVVPDMVVLTLIPLGYLEDLSPLGGGGGGGGILAAPQISATNGPIDLKIGTVVKQVK